MPFHGRIIFDGLLGNDRAKFAGMILKEEWGPVLVQREWAVPLFWYTTISQLLWTYYIGNKLRRLATARLEP